MKYLRVYISLFCSIGLLVAFLCAVLIQHRSESATLWAIQSADLYHTASERVAEDAAQNAGQKRLNLHAAHKEAQKAILKSLELDPYNANYWMRLALMQKNSGMTDTGERSAPEQLVKTMRIIKSLRPDLVLREDTFIVPLQRHNKKNQASVIRP